MADTVIRSLLTGSAFKAGQCQEPQDPWRSQARCYHQPELRSQHEEGALQCACGADVGTFSLDYGAGGGSGALEVRRTACALGVGWNSGQAGHSSGRVGLELIRGTLLSGCLFMADQRK